MRFSAPWAACATDQVIPGCTALEITRVMRRCHTGMSPQPPTYRLRFHPTVAAVAALAISRRIIPPRLTMALFTGATHRVRVAANLVTIVVREATVPTEAVARIAARICPHCRMARVQPELDQILLAMAQAPSPARFLTPTIRATSIRE